MWIVTKIADLVQLKPQDFYKTSLEAIEDKINEKYANKVIPNIGLCVCVWDITDASEGLIGQYDGYVNINVEFHMVVFRPHRGEVIQARIKEQTSQGMRRELYLLFLFVAASSQLTDYPRQSARPSSTIFGFPPLNCQKRQSCRSLMSPRTCSSRLCH